MSYSVSQLPQPQAKAKQKNEKSNQTKSHSFLGLVSLLFHILEMNLTRGFSPVIGKSETNNLLLLNMRIGRNCDESFHQRHARVLVSIPGGHNALASLFANQIRVYSTLT